MIKENLREASSALLMVVISAGLVSGVNSLFEEESNEIAKRLCYSEVYAKADKNTNKIIDYSEAYSLGRELNVTRETNKSNSFDEIFKKASLKDITHYLK